MKRNNPENYNFEKGKSKKGQFQKGKPGGQQARHCDQQVGHRGQQVGHCGQQIGHCGQLIGYCGQHGPNPDMGGRGY